MMNTNKKFVTGLLAGLMALSLTACGEDGENAKQAASSAESVSQEQNSEKSDSGISQEKQALSVQPDMEEGEEDFTTQLEPFYGTYRFDGNDNQAKDPNEIVIDEKGVTYGGKTLSILRVTLDNYVKFNDSDVMFIIDGDSVSANFLHPEDQSVLEIYPIVERVSANTEQSQISSEATDASMNEPDTEVASKMAGTYTGQHSTLAIAMDGSFTYIEDSNRLKATITGKLPDELAQGMAVQAGEYVLQINFREDYTAFMIDVKDGGGTSIGGDDLVRE